MGGPCSGAAGGSQGDAGQCLSEVHFLASVTQGRPEHGCVTAPRGIIPRDHGVDTAHLAAPAAEWAGICDDPHTGTLAQEGKQPDADKCSLGPHFCGILRDRMSLS